MPSLLQLDNLQAFDAPIVDNLDGHSAVLSAFKWQGQGPVELLQQVRVQLCPNSLS